MKINKSRNRNGLLCYCPAEQDLNPRKEWLEGVDFYQHAIKEFPEVEPLFSHIANESNSAPQYRKKLKQQGLSSGVSDYLLLAPKGEHPYMALELKKANRSKSQISATQKQFLKSAEEAGAFAVVAYGWMAALEALRDYMKK